MIIEKIKEALPTMAPVNRKIALYVLEKGPSVVFSSTRGLARVIGVSEASIVRFTQSLGFKGYIEFQRNLQDEVKQKLDPMEKGALTDLDILPLEQRLRRLAQNETRNLRKTMEEMDLSHMTRMIEGVYGAKRVFLSGFGVSRNLIRILEYALIGMLDKEIVSITGSISDYSPRLHSFASSDVLLIMNFPAYSREALQVSSFAKQAGGKVFLFTDSARCPLFSQADAVMRCENNSLLLANSYVGVMAVMQIFINMLLLHDKDASIARMQRTLDVEKSGYQGLGSFTQE